MTYTLAMMAMLATGAMAQTTMPMQQGESLHDVMQKIEKRFKVRFKYNVDTVGVRLPYADYRIRPYSLEQTLDNVCKPLEWNWWQQKGSTYKIAPYEYYRRHTAEGRQMLEYLSNKYADATQWEARRDSLRREVRRNLRLDEFMARLTGAAPQWGKVVKHDGYTTLNVCIETLPGEHVYATVYAPQPDRPTLRRWKTEAKARGGWAGYALIVCPDGHFAGGRYRTDEQQRLATLARMGAVCVDFDLYGWGESEKEYGKGSHETPRAHTVQLMNAEVMLNTIIASGRWQIDTRRIGANGGSGGGTHTVLLSVLDDRITASAPTVNLASHFDGGCPCESGMPVQMAAGGTCNPELLATFAPKPALVVSDGGDWTASVPELEYPYLQRIWGFYGKQDEVRNVHLKDERHDFGPNKRNAVYDFFISVFHLDRTMLDESKVTIMTAEQLQTR